ncbi:hypothetical protein N7507_007284 [Penicillium longicatenatum]|nr:hypothetical protein N7507_007284 [Penicillium longicatenatum]
MGCTGDAKDFVDGLSRAEAEKFVTLSTALTTRFPWTDREKDTREYVTQMCSLKQGAMTFQQYMDKGMGLKHHLLTELTETFHDLWARGLSNPITVQFALTFIETGVYLKQEVTFEAIIRAARSCQGEVTKVTPSQGSDTDRMASVLEKMEATLSNSLKPTRSSWQPTQSQPQTQQIQNQPYRPINGNAGITPAQRTNDFICWN